MNFRWINDLNVKSKTLKIVEDDVGDYFYNIGMKKAFLNMIYVKEKKGKKPKIKRFDYLSANKSQK